MGVIYYRDGYPGPATYQVHGDGTGQSLLEASLTLGRPTSMSDYLGGRIFFWTQSVGTIPGTTYGYGNIMVWNQAGSSKPVTAFNGPVYATTYSRTRWSNDGQDSFFSFYGYDSTTARWHVYRANVTAAEAANPDFQPLISGDTRLEEVTSWAQLPDDYAWHPSGTKLFYLDQRFTGQWKVRLKVVAVVSIEDNDLVLFDQGNTGVRPNSALVASPATEQLVFDGYSPATGANGLISLNSATAAWSWIALDAAPGKPGLSENSNPMFSPDGTGIAFSAKTFVSSKKGGTYTYGLYKMPANGGLASLLTQNPSDGMAKLPEGWTW
jgi:hypothetical protein